MGTTIVVIIFALAIIVDVFTNQKKKLKVWEINDQFAYDHPDICMAGLTTMGDY